MRVLANFIMRGRVQAAVVAIAGSWFPLISPATVALVTLRRGSLDGSMILLWAMLPALAALWISNLGPLMPVVTFAGLLVTYLAAQLLRSSNSWPSTMMGVIALSCLLALLTAMAIPDPVADITRALGDMFAQMQAEAPEGTAILAPSENFVVGLIAYVVAVSSLLSVLLGRWWQALLYNPGGLQAEFHSLRLSPVQALACFAALLYCWLQGGDYRIWASVFGLPLVLVGVAIVHYAVKARAMGVQWLILFYLGLLLVSPLTALLAIMAVMDTWIDFRSRIKVRLDKSAGE